ncbi:MAG: dihydroorotate dehydrogenase electron transfer subunit [Muribaculaceae bacterium]|nr:dihydroorotate dehydrogenase electron transfer subunit [Muribaculaceae bacterium]
MIQVDFTIVKNNKLGNGFGLLILEAPEVELCALPGQFVQVYVPDSPKTFLRRPISICNIEDNKLWLLIRNAGHGTEHLLNMSCGSKLNVIIPLGRGFKIPSDFNSFRPLLAGGGVGVAPLLYYGIKLKELGCKPSFLLAAKTKSQLLLIDEFSKYGDVYISTDDGSCGEKGLITENSVLMSNAFNYVGCCGPMPMMKAIHNVANKLGVECEVSLENLMGCGIGACLCCVEDTKDSGNVCVCKEGPVFNIERLKW